jgi:hypothetical protein
MLSIEKLASRVSTIKKRPASTISKLNAIEQLVGNFLSPQDEDASCRVSEIPRPWPPLSRLLAPLECPSAPAEALMSRSSKKRINRSGQSRLRKKLIWMRQSQRFWRPYLS